MSPPKRNDSNLNTSVMRGTVDMIGFLVGAEKYPTILITNFCSKTMLLYFLLYCLYESSTFRVFGDHLALHNSFASILFTIFRSTITGIVGIIWLCKTEEGSLPPKSGLSKLISSHILHLQSVAILLMTLALSIQAAYDVLVLNPQRVGLSPNAILSLAGLKQVTPLSFFVMRDTPVRALAYAWGINVVVCIACCLYAQDREQIMVLLLYAVVTFMIFSDAIKQNKTMCEMITKLQNTLKENEELAVEAQALELRAMIGNVAHDLKTPLTSFLSGIECMHDMLAEWTQALHDPDFKWTDECLTKCRAANKEMLQCLQNMSDANSFMTMTINRCLDYTKTTKGFKLVPTFETVSLKQALEMPHKLIQGAQHAISINVHAVPDSICSYIITDKQWLIENLLCLLSNAAKYSAKGTVDVNVKMITVKAENISRNPHAHRSGADPSPTCTSTFLRFEVQDTGIGLSDEAMQGLFNPFKQAQRLAGGTGLGLFSLAKRVEALQGQYGVMRRPDGEQGSLFWFTIPYRSDEMTSTVLKQAPASFALDFSVPNTAGRTSEVVYCSPRQTDIHFHVLVVDDAPLIVKMTTMLLQRKGHTVHHAVNGADALEKLVSSPDCPSKSNMEMKADVALPFDVVLMDLQMPVLDGIEAIRRLRAAEVKLCDSQKSAVLLSRRQFVIALSANSDEETRQEALAAGADAFIPKPFTYERFAEVMTNS